MWDCREVNASLCDKVLLFHQRSDYINASFMDGYKQRRAYIGTQGRTTYIYLEIIHGRLL